MIRWLSALLLFTCAPALYAASTTTWEMNNYRDFIRGRFTGVSLSREGRLALAPRLDTVLASDQPVVWSIAQTPDGALYAATGHRGRVFRIDKSGAVSTFWTAEEPEVFSLAVSPNGVLYAATSPNGKIFRFENGKAVEFFSPKVTYIWSMAFARDGSLFVGTGDRGQVFRVDPSGKGELYYETGQAHVTCLALDAQGRVLAGTEPNGIIYRMEAANKAFVLYDASLPEIRAISMGPDGAIYAAAQGGAGMRRALTGMASPAGTATGAQITATAATVTVTEEDMQAGIDLKPSAEAPRQATVTPQVSAQFSPVSDFPGVEKSALYKILPDNTVETIWSSKDENIYDLIASAGQVSFSTDARGRVYRLMPDGKVTLLAQTNEGEATRLLDTAAGLLAATGGGGKIYRLATDLSASGVYESPVHDAGSVARWGRLSWIAETGRNSKLVFYARTGNSMRPDQTWSEWAGPLTDPDGSRIPAPNARFIQWKAEFSGAAGSTPVLDNVTLAYLPQNTPPSVKNIMVTTVTAAAPSAAKPPSTQTVSSSYSITVTETGESVPPTSAGTPTQTLARGAARQLQIVWQAEDPDNDRLDYAVHFRGEGEREWKLMKAHLRDNSLLLDADMLADGRYLFRVTATDSPDNSPDTAKEAELISAPVLLDNTPPVITAGVPKRTGDTVAIEFEAADAASSLRRAEYSLDAGHWVPAEAADGILDSPRERIQVRLNSLPPGEHLLTLRVYDSAGNAGLAKVVLR